jgi:hypothetical protein
LPKASCVYEFEIRPHKTSENVPSGTWEEIDQVDSTELLRK